MGIRVELLSEYDVELIMWEDRKRIAVERAKEDLNLIVPLVEGYYDDRRPQGDKVVYSWEVGTGVEAFRRFLDSFLVVSVQYPKAKVKVSR